MKLTGTHYAYARRRQQVTITETGTRHAVRIVVERGGVHGVGFRVGSAAGTQDVLEEVVLGTGEHIVSFVPQANVWLELNHLGTDPAYVTSCEIFDDSDLVLTSSWNLGELGSLRYDQSGDVLYVGAGASGGRPRKIIRRGDYSWSLEDYEPVTGPFLGLNPTTTTLTPSALTGEITLAASKDLFKGGHLGALFRLISVAQQTSDVLSGANQFGSSVRVTGVGTARNVTLTITGTWTATITLQRSIGDENNWTDVTTYTANQAGITYNDALDNQIAYYRLGIKTGNYTSGSATVALSFASGSNTGVLRITGITSAQAATAVVLDALGSTNATEDWYEGRWSDYRGWPAAPVLDDGRLGWLGRDRAVLSESDDFEGFDPSAEGDAGPIDRSIGSGPVDTIFWALSLTRLICGAAAGVYAMRASAQDEPLTPTAASLRKAVSQGSANLQAVAVDEGCVYVSRSRQRVYEMVEAEGLPRYVAEDLTLLVPDLFSEDAYIVAIAVQHQPETRVHCVLSDGTAAVLVYNRAEQVKAWWLVEMGSTANESIVDVVIQPGDGREDHVYYLILSGTTYCLTKWAQRSECQGGESNKQVDLFVAWTSSASSITVPTFLNGRTFHIWADGAYEGTAVVSAGSLALGATYTEGVAGLTYNAQWRSTKLGKVLGRKKNAPSIALIVHNTHHEGVYFGRDFTDMDPLPQVKEGATVAADTVHTDWETPALVMRGEWNTDARLCLKAVAPKPATVQAVVVDVEAN